VETRGKGREFGMEPEAKIRIAVRTGVGVGLVGHIIDNIHEKANEKKNGGG